MKKPNLTPLLCLTFLFIGITAGLFLGRNLGRPEVTVSVPAAMQTMPPEVSETSARETEAPVTFPVNINTADKRALMALPDIGEVFAQRILDYRDAHGPFPTVEALMNVEGIGEGRMEALLEYITVGG